MNVVSIVPSPTLTEGPTRSAEAGEGRAPDKVNDRDADNALPPARQTTPARTTGRFLDIKV
jgi:hypothetical protein